MSPTDARVLVFDSKLRENFLPLTLTRIGPSLLFGTNTLKEHIEGKLGVKITNFLVPDYLAEISKEQWPGIEVNQSIPSPCIVINSFISYRAEIWKFMATALNEPDEILYTDDSGIPVFGKLGNFEPSKIKLLQILKKRNSSKVKIKTLPRELGMLDLLRYPWDLVRDNPEKIDSDYVQSKFSTRDGYTSSRGNDVEILGSKVAFAESADLQRYVTIDARKGPVIIDEKAEVQSFTHITGPCYIGKQAKIRSARIREGTTVGAISKVAGEVETSIISEYSNKSHDGFLGHSILGSWVNLGALTTCSDLKNTYGKIRVRSGRKSVDTGQIKVGVFLADMAKTAVGALLASGTSVGVASQIFGFVSGNVPSFTLYGKSLGARSSEVILESALTTQRRMMERRGIVMSAAFGALIRSIYKMTKRERAFQRVARSRFKLP